MTLLRRFRGWLRDLLAGVHGPRLQALAWALAGAHPRLRIVGSVRRGQILAPLAALRAADSRMPEVRRLQARLQDMAAFLSGDGRPQAPGRARGPARPFEGRVLLALHSCGAYDPSGYASRSEALAHALRRRGVQPTIALRPGYPWDLAAHRHAQRHTRCEHHGLTFELRPDPAHGLGGGDSDYIDGYAEHLGHLAAAHRSELIHAASNYLNGAAAALAAGRAGLPSLYEVRGLWHLTRASAEPGYAGSDHFRYCEARELAACQAVDHVLTLSPGLRDWLVARGVAAERITILGNAAMPPTEDAEARRAAGLVIRQRLGIAPDARVIGYLGSLVEYEGLEELLYAQARTHTQRRPTLLIVGGGRQQPALTRLARRLGTTRQVIFAGRVGPAEVGACYAAMDAVVLPRRDTQLTRLVPALKPFEVVAHRRPLFVSRALAQALGPTLPPVYRVVAVEEQDDLDALFDDLPAATEVEVPSWDRRAETLTALYRRLLE